MSETGDGLRAQAQRVISWTLATWALGRIFDGFEAWLTEALREEDEMANESEARSCIGCECEGDGCSACEAEKPHECNADSEVELEPCGVCTGCGCPSRCEEEEEEEGPSLQLAQKNYAEMLACSEPQEATEVERLRLELDNALTLVENWKRQAAEQYPGHKADLELLAERGERIRKLEDETIPELQRALHNERARYNKLQEMHRADGEKWIDWQRKADEFREERDVARREIDELRQTIEERKKGHEKAMERLRAKMWKVAAAKGAPPAPEQPDLPDLIERLETLEQFMRDVKNRRTW